MEYYPTKQSTTGYCLVSVNPLLQQGGDAEKFHIAAKYGA